MYENMTDDFLRERMLSRVSDKLDKRPSALIYDTHEATANELAILYTELEYLVKNAFGDTASREFLILLARDRGLAPEAATKAILKGEFTPSHIDVTGKRFNIGEVNYVVLERILPGQYQVQCETEGSIGNLRLGTMMPIDYINGLQTAQLTEILIPGEDEEDTETFRQRYFDSFQERAFAGNQAAYIEAVKKISGVGNLKVTRVWNGDIRPAELIPSAAVTAWYNSVIGGLESEAASWLSAVFMAAAEKKLTVGGTVLITVVNSLDFGEASDVLLEKIQTEIDPDINAGEGSGLAPIGHVVRVKSADPVQVDVRAAVTFDDGYNWTNTRAAIQEAVGLYLLELRKAWADSHTVTVRISQVETRILGVKGVLDVTATEINGSADNLMLTKYQIPVLGGVSA